MYNFLLSYHKVVRHQEVVGATAYEKRIGLDQYQKAKGKAKKTPMMKPIEGSCIFTGGHPLQWLTFLAIFHHPPHTHINSLPRSKIPFKNRRVFHQGESV